MMMKPDETIFPWFADSDRFYSAIPTRTDVEPRCFTSGSTNPKSAYSTSSLTTLSNSIQVATMTTQAMALAISSGVAIWIPSYLNVGHG